MVQNSNNNTMICPCVDSNYLFLGAIARNRLWYDNAGIGYNMYQPTCFGNETNILECHYNVIPSIPNRCSNYRYSSDETSVVCLPGIILFSLNLAVDFRSSCSDGQIGDTQCEDGQLRLSGESPYRGRVEICKGSVWGTVCYANGFSSNDAAVICRMLGYQPDHTSGRIVSLKNKLASLCHLLHAHQQ